MIRKTSLILAVTFIGTLCPAELRAQTTEAPRIITSNNNTPPRLSDLIEFPDAYKPGTLEVREKYYTITPWSGERKTITQNHLSYLYAKAPGLIRQGAMGRKIRVYSAQIKSIAKGGKQIIVLGNGAFPKAHPERVRRVVIHEVVHTADAYNLLSNSKSFRRIIEPKLIHARKLLKKENLTPQQANALPWNTQRIRLEKLVRRETGLPGIYATTNLSECLAEMTSYWLDDLYKYTPPQEIIPLLKKFISQPQPPTQGIINYHKALDLFSANKTQDAIPVLDDIIKKHPNFYHAVALRGWGHESLGKTKLALEDLKRVIHVMSPYESKYGYYYNKWMELEKKVARAGQ